MGADTDTKPRSTIGELKSGLMDHQWLIQDMVLDVPKSKLETKITFLLLEVAICSLWNTWMYLIWILVGLEDMIYQEKIGKTPITSENSLVNNQH